MVSSRAAVGDICRSGAGVCVHERTSTVNFRESRDAFPVILNRFFVAATRPPRRRPSRGLKWRNSWADYTLGRGLLVLLIRAKFVIGAEVVPIETGCDFPEEEIGGISYF